MQAITLQQFQSQSAHYLAQVAQGHTFLLLDGSQVVATLAPYAASTAAAPPSAQSTEAQAPLERHLQAQALGQALEGLAEIAASIALAQKEHEALLQKAREWESKALLLIKQGQANGKTPEEVNALAVEVLKEQEKATQLADAKLREISELEYLKSQLHDKAEQLRALEAQARHAPPPMPDSSETLSMLERMKTKVAQAEELAKQYAAEAKQREADALLEKKVNDLLGIDRQKEQAALAELKAKLGLK